MTHTYTTMEVSPEAFAEISTKLRAAGYDHAFDDGDKTIDMHGIGLVMGGTVERKGWPDALTSDFAKALEEHKESIPVEIWSHIDKLQREVDFSRGGKLGDQKLEDRIKELEAALKPFSDVVDDIYPEEDDTWDIWEHPAAMGIYIGELRAAREVTNQQGRKLVADMNARQGQR